MKSYPKKSYSIPNSKAFWLPWTSIFQILLVEIKIGTIGFENRFMS